MSKLNQWQMTPSPAVPAFGDADRPLRAALPRLAEHAVLAGMFAGWAGFWIVVIWWLAA